MGRVFQGDHLRGPMEDWRLVDDVPASGAENMATDEALLRASESALTPPTLRLYEWSEPTVTVGYLQGTEPFKGCGLPIVRRITGGRAVLHNIELTYSLVCPSSAPLYISGISGGYRFVSACIQLALADMGLASTMVSSRPSRTSMQKSSCFHGASRFELTVDEQNRDGQDGGAQDAQEKGRKLSGSAQRRFKGAFLQHGSIIFGLDRVVFDRVFGEGSSSRVGCVEDVVLSAGGTSRFARYDASEAISSFKEAFVKRVELALGIALRPGGLSEFEEQLKNLFLREKYSNPVWNLKGEGSSTAPWRLRDAS